MMKFERTLALRFLREGRMQTALIIGGTSIGVSLIIFITGVITGVQADLVDRTLGTQSHIVIRPPDEVNSPQFYNGYRPVVLATTQARAQRLRSIDQWQYLAAELATLPEVVALTPTVSGPGFVLRGEVDKSITIYGIDPEPYVQVTKLDEKIVTGSLDLNPDDAIIGIELAKDLGVGVGDKVYLKTARSTGSAFNIRGIYDIGNRDANRRLVYVNLRTGQAILDLAGGASSLDIAVKDVFTAEKIASTLRQRTDQKVESWEQTNRELYTALANQTIMTRIVRTFVAVIVAIGITSVLVVSVVQKQKEIGILRAIGASRGDILRVFLIQGAVIGVIGAIVGCVVGTGLMALGSRVLRAADGSTLFQVQFSPELYASAALVALVFGLLAATVPARRAAGLDPAKAIRV
ncbi:MAG: ABC transporter permease [Deltaproteobacteria bacterium]|nr:ABC transporter permease [Deltaproteobacteria bacterium]